jgi:uncharacterized membrane protein required for colicin V production
MNIVDAIIILILILGVVIGLKRGFTSQLVSFLGVFAVIILAFLLKNPVSIFLYEHLPFFKFAGVIKGVTVLNIALYELIAFIIVLSILMVILKVIIHLTNIIETLLKITIIFAPISKIGGAIVGFIESYVWVFIILYILCLPVFNVPFVNESKLKNVFLEKTPILSNIIDDSMNVINEFVELRDKYETTPDASQFNRETLDLFLKYDVVSVDSINKLVEKDKLKIDNIDEIINKYKEA